VRKPQVVPDEDHEVVYERVAAVDVGRAGSGVRMHTTPDALAWNRSDDQRAARGSQVSVNAKSDQRGRGNRKRPSGSGSQRQAL
jgi:hypothetical protein